MRQALSHGHSVTMAREIPASPERFALRLAAPGALEPADRAKWDELGNSALTASIFAEPWLMRRSLAHCDREGRARLAIVEGAEGEWLGAMPVTTASRHGKSPMPNWSAWRHPNQFVGTPLVRQGHATDFWRGLIAGLGARALGRIALCLHDLPLDDPVNAALLSLCEGEHRRMAIDRRFSRARLDTDSAGGDLSDLKPGQRRRIQSLERKLERELGPVSLAVTRDPGEVATQLERFLALERAGWKGRAGSAIACADSTTAFFSEVAAAAAHRGRFEVATLSAGGRTLAISTQLVGRQRCYGFKMAYDEAYSSFAPGLVLLTHMTRSFRERGLGEVDSCTAPGQQPVSRLWPERRELIDCRVALGGALRGHVFAGILACEALRAGHDARRDGGSSHKP